MRLVYNTNFNLVAIYQDLKKQEKKSRRKILSLAKKRIAAGVK